MFKDLISQVFGRLTVKKRLPNDKYRRAVWLCECSCDGKLKEVTSQGLLSGNTQSCGCLVVETAKRVNTKHGGTAGGVRKSEYVAYINAKRRCVSTSAQAYSRYGARGIQFKFTSYEEFIAELGPKPSPELTVERINNNGNYEKGNVMWATKKQQANNRRKGTCAACNRRNDVLILSRPLARIGLTSFSPTASIEKEELCETI